MNNFRTGTQLRARTSRVPSSRPGDRSRARTHALPTLSVSLSRPCLPLPRFSSVSDASRTREWSTVHRSLLRLFFPSRLSHLGSVSLSRCSNQPARARARARRSPCASVQRSRRSTILVSFIFHYGAIILGPTAGLTHRVSD